MDSAVSTRRKISPGLAAGMLGTTLALAGGLFYLSRPVASTSQDSAPASPESKAYVSQLQLSDVTMQATENLAQQRVVEVQGKIGNNGSRALRAVEIYCLFYGIDGREIHRERISILQGAGKPLQPQETRSFRLPFDTLPDGWNQAVPRMVIAQIRFAS